MDSATSEGSAVNGFAYLPRETNRTLARWVFGCKPYFSLFSICQGGLWRVICRVGWRTRNQIS
jgi:hypothetical protein